MTKIIPCPKCKKEGESDIEETHLVCPFCGHDWDTEPWIKIKVKKNRKKKII